MQKKQMKIFFFTCQRRYFQNGMSGMVVAQGQIMSEGAKWDYPLLMNTCCNQAFSSRLALDNDDKIRGA